MNKNISPAAIAHFISFNRFAFSPTTALAILTKKPKAKYVRPLSYWLLNGYNVNDNAHVINVPLPKADFFFLRQNEKIKIQYATEDEKQMMYNGAELFEEITFWQFPFYDVYDTNCKLRRASYSIEHEALYGLTQKLGLKISFKPLHKLFINSYIFDNTMVLPTNNCAIHPALLLKHIAEHILFATSTQSKQITEFEFYLVQIMLNATVKEKIPIYEVPIITDMNESQLITSLERCSKLVVFLMENVNIFITKFDELELSYALKPEEQPQKNIKKFRGLKSKKGSVKNETR